MVSIIIRAKNGHDLTEACIRSIIANTPADSYRIILVDDGSYPPIGADMWGENPNVEFVLRSCRSRGAVTATNIGLGLALQLDGDYIMILDNDTEIPAGDIRWLSRFVAELEQFPTTGAVGAVTNFAKAVQHALTVPITYTGDWQSENAWGIRDNPAVVEFVSFAVLMRKAAVQQVGFWDERYNPGNYEDTDYALQMRSAGWEVRVARSVYIHHRGHQTFASDLDRLLQENGQRFVEKWGPGRLWDLQMLPSEAMQHFMAHRGRS